jgi:predicted hydrocarbon binding protein
MVPELSGLYYPNRLARSFFLAMDDVMGRHGLSALLQLAGLEQFEAHIPPNDMERAFDFAYISALNLGLEEMYGQRGGRGMALRIGSAAFAQGFKNFGAMRGMSDPAFRALPMQDRIQLGLTALASVLSHFTDQTSHLVVEDNSYVFTCEYCPFAWGRVSDKPVCHAMVGIIQECLRLASNGYEFYVREVACRACGDDACVFRINKTAIGENK